MRISGGALQLMGRWFSTSLLATLRGRPILTGVLVFTEDRREARKVRHNERVKLVASMLNGLAIGLATTGVVGPLVALFLRNPDKPLSALSISLEALVFMGIWSGLGLALHLGAHFVMGWLR